jgi:serine/threonine-protein kinase
MADANFADGSGSQEATRLDNAVARFEQAWHEGTRPRIQDYLSPGASRQVLLGLARVDLQFRLKAGELVCAESYLARFPELAEDAEIVLDLVSAEFKLRRQAGDGVSVEEYTRRFPHLRQALEDRLVRDSASHTSSYVPGDPLPGQTPAAPSQPIPLRGSSPVSDAPAGADTTASACPRFRILRLHAAGGLGEVFVAFDEELRREVALKEIRRRYADSPEGRARFLLEAEVTGCLEHPGVVPVYGLGRYPDGRPYYAMRLIRGRSLEEAINQFYAAGARASADRLSLEFRNLLTRFVDVCNAVAFAHSRGVIHRDLKPQNIMLGPYGETLVVDWGLAKVGARDEGRGEREGRDDKEEPAVRPASAKDVSPTRMGDTLGTPAYMSPEQAAGMADRVGPASDIYSLGATLYCLLTGRSPFDDVDADQLLERVQRGEFRRPRLVDPTVPAALEAICLKAMARPPEDRYANPQNLADEVERWLAGEPVVAFGEPLIVRARRWARRHRALVSSAAAGAGVALVSLAVSTSFLAAANRQAVAERDRADHALAEARQAVEDYCTGIADDPQLQRPELQNVRRKLLQTAIPFAEEFVPRQAGDPGLVAARARALRALAKLRSDLGERDEAVAGYRRSAEMFEELVQKHPQKAEYRQELALSTYKLGVLFYSLGRHADAQTAFRRSLDLRTTLAAEYPAIPSYRLDKAQSHNGLGNLLENLGRYADAEVEYQSAMALREALVAAYPSDPEYQKGLAQQHNNLAVLVRQLGRSRESEDHWRASLALLEALARQQPSSADIRDRLAMSHHNLGNLLADGGRHPQAEVAYQHALDLRQGLVDEQPSFPEYRYRLAQSLSRLAVLLDDEGRRGDAEPLYRKTLSFQERLVEDFPRVPEYRRALAGTHNNLAVLLTDLGRWAEAQEQARHALALYARLARDHPAVPDYTLDLGCTRVTLADTLREQGQLAAALEDYDQALALMDPILIREPRLQTARFYVREACGGRAQVLAHLGRLTEADKSWTRAVELSSPEDRPRLRLRQETEHARLGQHVSAASRADMLLQTPALNGDTLYQGARLFAVASASAAPDAALARRYADRALDLLGRAVARGFTDFDKMKRDPDLVTLRQGPKFRAIQSELETRSRSKGR